MESEPKIIEQVTEHEHINLDEARGWDLLLEYIESLEDEFIEKFSKEDEVVLQKIADAIHEFSELRTKCIKVLSEGGEITFADSEKAQELSDRVTDIVDYYVPAEKSQIEVTEGRSEKVEEKEPETVTAPSWETDNDKPEQTQNDEEKELETEVIEEIIEEEQEEENEKETEFDGSEVLRGIISDIVKLENAFAEAKIEPILKEELMKISRRAKALKEQLDSSVEVPSTTEDVLEEIQKNLTQVQLAFEKIPHQEIKKPTLLLEEGHPEPTGEMKIFSDEHDIKPINISVPVKEEKIPGELSALKPEASKWEVKNLVSERLQKDQYYNRLLAAHNLTWKQVDRNLKKSILDVERPDKLDMFLRVQHGSVFTDLLKDISIKELSEIEHGGADVIKEELRLLEEETGKQYQYRVYRSWLNQFDDMAAVVRLRKDMTFGELCTLFELVKLLPEEELQRV